MKNPNRSPRHESVADADDAFNAALDHCLCIETLGGLLAAAGQRALAGALEARPVANTGALIERKTRQLQAALRRLHPPATGGIAPRKRTGA